MSRAAADKQDEREASFKEGLGAGLTDRRASDAAALRKKKKQSLLSRRRGIERPNTDDQLERMLALYKGDALVAGDTSQLRLLRDILERANTAVLNEKMPLLANSAVLATLVKHSDREDCAEALHQLTGIETRWELDIARDVVKSGFFAAMADEQNAIRPVFWDILMNILLTGGKQACEVLFRSPFYGRGIFHKVAPQVPAPRFLSVVGAIFEADPLEPPLALIEFVWPNVMHTLINVIQPQQWIHMDETQRILVNSVTNIIECIFYGLGLIHRADLSKALVLKQPVDLVRKLRDIIRTCNSLGLVARVFEIMVRISALVIDDHRLHHIMREAGCVNDMMQGAAHTDAAIRLWSLLWIGNYMADGTPFVRDMLQAGVMPVLCEAMERAPLEIKSKAIYALMNALAACDYDLHAEASGGELRGLADQTLHSLVFGHKIYPRLCEHLGLPGLDALSVDVLRCLRTGLSWNRQRVLDSLRAYHIHERIEDMVAQLKASNTTALYELAVEVDDLIAGRTHENREAALEAANAMAFDMETTEEAPNTYMGRFDF
jgi:hypothetical protein